MTASTPLGRPLKFESVEELQTEINLYFDECDKSDDNRIAVSTSCSGRRDESW